MRFVAEVYETVTNLRQYVIEANTLEEATKKAETGETEDEHELALGTVDHREVHQIAAAGDDRPQCRDCGEAIELVDGAWRHCDTLAEDGPDIDGNHAALPDTDE